MSDEETQWVVYWGGSDPDSCAGWQVCADEAEALEDAQWRVDGGVAKRTVSYGGWWVHDGAMLNDRPLYVRILRDVIG